MGIYYQIRQKCKNSASHDLNSEWKEKYIFVLGENGNPVCLVQVRLLRIHCEKNTIWNDITRASTQALVSHYPCRGSDLRILWQKTKFFKQPTVIFC